MENPLKRKADSANPNTTLKRAKPSLPKHAKRMFIQAKLSWTDQYGRHKTHEARLLLDCGCSGPILNKDFVWKTKVPWTRREVPISVLTADGEPMKEAGERYSPDLIMRIGHHQEELSWEVATLEEGIDGYLPVGWLQQHNPDIQWDTGKMEWRSDYCKKHCLPVSIKDAVRKFVQLVEEGKPWQVVSGTTIWHNSEGGDIAQDLPEQYQEWASVFSEEEINKLPEHGPWDHEIHLEEGSKPPFGPIYPLSEFELEILRDYIKQQLAHGKIRRSTSSAGSPIIFIPKSDGSLRLCVDYRGLNKITIKDRTPLPLMTELRERVGKARIFTKLDLKNGYNLIRIAMGDEWKTAFRTKYGLFEYLVMRFGLCNAPATFQAMINEVLRELLDEGVIVYIDDILIYTETEEEHVILVQKVLEKLKKAHLCVSIKKSVFHVREVDYLGYVISDKGISMSPSKVRSIENWERPHPEAKSALKWAQEFLGFANFYRRFIEGFSKIAKPLSDLTKKDIKYEWTPQCEEAFTTLKQMFTQAPILVHFNSADQTVVETDASDFALGAVLSQVQPTGVLHPVAFHSRKFLPAEINYDIHDKEMLAIVTGLKEWEHMLRSCKDEFIVYTDHKNLEYFASTKVLSRRQARWAEFLAEFWFKVVYRPGHLNTKADVLSRRRDYAPKEGGEPTQQSLFKPGQWVVDSARIASTKVFELPGTFIARLKAAAEADLDWQATLKAVRENSEAVAPEFEDKDGILYYENRYVIPSDTGLRLKILGDNHDSRVAGHFGQFKTLERLKQNFFWTKMDEDVKDYVRSCDVCQRDKASRKKKYGLLQPLDIPHQPWKSIAMDFIVGLPESNGFTQIWVVIDRLTKMGHFIPMTTGEKSPAQDLAKTFAREIWRLHGLPSDIVSDRGSVFISSFWKELMEHLGVELNMSTAFHPQTDGQTERVNQVLETYLRHYCNFQQDDWAELLPLAEHAYNTATSEATKVSPFFANYHFNPETQWVRPREPGEMEWTNPASELLMQRWQNTWSYLQDNILNAQQRMAKYYDRRVQKQPEYKEGDMVMVNMKNMKTKRPSKKLDHKKLGPVKILAKVGKRAVRVELPPQAKNHPVFHVSELEPYRPSNLEGRHQPPPPMEEIEGEDNWVVESIGKSRMNKKRKRVEYLVFWEGYPPEDATWEPWENLEGTADKLLEDFHRRYPRQERDPHVTVS